MTSKSLGEGQRLVVLGGGYAGILAAVRLSRLVPRARLTLIGQQPTFVERVRLHEVAAGGRVPSPRLVDLLAGTGVSVLVGEVVELRADAGALVVERSVGMEIVPFDRLIVATGSRADFGALAGQTSLLHEVASLDGALRIRAAIAAGARRVIVVGGGATGVETAAELAERSPGLGVTLVAAGGVLPTVSATARAHAERTLARLGVDASNERVVAVEPSSITLASGRAVPTDLVIWAGGFAPTALGRDAGLACAADGRVLVDRHLRAIGSGAIYVVGDAASVTVGDQVLRMGCASAMPMGAHAADAIAAELAGATPAPFDFRFTGLCVSLGRRDGVVQLVDARDVATAHALRGRSAAWVKERVCRYAARSAIWERRGLLRYRWPKAPPTLTRTHVARLT